MNELLIPIIMFTVGLVVIIKGGDAFVDAARWMSEVTGIPKIIVGATIISFATTLPELIVSSLATIDGSIGIATGNAIGSVIANLGIGLSLVIICSSMHIDPADFNFKGLIMIAVTAVLFIFGTSGKITIVSTVVLFAMLGIYMYSNIKSAQEGLAEAEDEIKPIVTKKILLTNIALFVFGAAGIIWGADLLVDNGQIIAKALGVSDAVIGLTVIAVGTSLPELVTAVTSVAKGEGALSIGNILGANIIDMAMILPVCSLISGGTLQITNATVFVDIPVALALMIVAVVPTIIARKFRKWQGFLILGIYASYLVYVVNFI